MRTALLAFGVLAAACGRSRVPPPAEPDDPAPGTFAEAPPAAETGFPDCDKQRASASEPDKVLATIERTACFGWCPVYTVTVFRDGLVLYVGSQFVLKCEGIAHLEPDQLQALEDVFVDAGYLKLADAYDEHEMTDAPSVITSYSPRPGVTKTIKHYGGDSHAPPTLEALEGAIDRIIDIEQFIGTEAQRERAFHAMR